MTRTFSELLLFITRSPELTLLLKTTLVLALGLALVWAARSARASVRHLLLACTFAGLFALPFAAKIAPEFQVELNTPAIEQPATPVVASTTEPVRQRQERSSISSSTNVSKWSILSFTRTALWSVWALGAALFLGSLAVALVQLRSIRRGAIPFIEARNQLSRVAADSGVRRPIEVLLHQNVSVPFTYGHRRPAILLPTEAATWSNLDLQRVFVHELEHIKRGDWLVQVFSRAVCSIYWFQPLAWIAWRKICLEAERASDDAVLMRTERTDYAEQLVGLARRLSNSLPSPVLSMANRSDLSRRVRSILDNNQARGRAGLRWTIMVLSFSVVIVTAIAPSFAISRKQGQTQQVTSQKVSDVRTKAIDRAFVEAAEDGELKEMEELLNFGANINAAVSGDGTALIVAAKEGNKSLVEFLLARGADVNQSSPGDGNPLIMAAREGHVEIVRLLLDRNANIDAIVEGDENPLIQASGEGRIEVVKLLISRGANVNARAKSDRLNGEWRTPLNQARKGGHKEIEALLISAGAQQ